MSANWTADQIARIRKAIRVGRLSMSISGVNKLVFAEAFIKAGGIQVPGHSNIDEATQRHIGNHVLSDLIEGKGPRYAPGELDWFFDSVVREMNRAMSEVHWYSSAQHPDAVGFKLVIFSNTADVECCQQYVNQDRFGMGQGIFPKKEIVVPPPCCDRASFEIVFKDEIK